MNNKVFNLIFALLLCGSVFGQAMRFNTGGNAIGIQTPNQWSAYSHMEIKLFPHPFVDSIRISAMFMQFGYNWIKRNKGNVRSTLKVAMWGFVPSYRLFAWSALYKYIDLVPIGILLYPFESKVLGIDLYVIFDPYSATITNGMTLIVNLN